MTFELRALRFNFIAEAVVHFPAGKTANLFRGQLGKAMKRASPKAYERFFAPVANGPSGLHDPPRPFVLRVRHLEGTSAERFSVGINVFSELDPAFEMLAPFHARLESVEGHEPIRLDFTPVACHRIRVNFLTPTELKGADRPEFGVLLARIRDRISTLRALYGAGPLEIDFKAFGDRASRITMTRCEIEHVKSERVSKNTGQRHSLGGFVGVAEYEGDLGEFVPYLEIARWTGVGRQTVWGKGEIACETF